MLISFFQQNLSLVTFVCRIRSHLCVDRGEGEKHSDHFFSETIGNYFSGGCVLLEWLCWGERMSYMPACSRGSVFLRVSSVLTVMAGISVSTELRS